MNPLLRRHLLGLVLAAAIVILPPLSAEAAWVVTDLGYKVWHGDTQPDVTATWTGTADAEGCVTGSGVLQWYDKDGKIDGTYNGAMVGGMRSGKGTFAWPSGDRYEGEYFADRMNGRGIYTWAGGSRYEGDFAEGKPNGKGKMTWGPDTKMAGCVYEGDFVNGVRTGKGVFIWPGGDRYEGDFVADKRTGKGILAYHAGGRYEGDFVDGQFEGEGTFHFPDGTVKTGRWAKSVPL